SRQLELIPPALSRRTAQGVWYYEAQSRNRALVFAVMVEGILQPCVAWVAEDGRVRTLSPLQRPDSLRSVSEGLIKMYLRRIETDKMPEVRRIASFNQESL
ncbi:MAG: hypothetical protein LBS86_03705, partial [Treponema sp.]|nr:hypothetical protein [Treponema sp.]